MTQIKPNFITYHKPLGLNNKKHNQPSFLGANQNTNKLTKQEKVAGLIGSVGLSGMMLYAWSSLNANTKHTGVKPLAGISIMASAFAIGMGATHYLKKAANMSHVIIKTERHVSLENFKQKLSQNKLNGNLTKDTNIAKDKPVIKPENLVLKEKMLKYCLIPKLILDDISNLTKNILKPFSN